jgi:hypothetical protein
MARIDPTDVQAKTASQARDVVRSNEQAWRKAMDGALFELLKRDPEAARQDLPSKPQLQAAKGQPAVRGDARVNPSAPIDSGASSDETPSTVANPMASTTPPVQPARSELIRNPDMAPAAPQAAVPALAAVRTLATPAQAAATAGEPDAVPVPTTAIGMTSLPQPAAPAPIASDDHGAPLEQPEPADRRSEQALSVPTDTHVFLEHTGNGAVLWMRDARGDAATLSPSLKFLLAESARQGVKVTGVRLNGRALAWPELNSIPHSDHPQGEDHGR